MAQNKKPCSAQANGARHSLDVMDFRNLECERIAESSVGLSIGEQARDAQARTLKVGQYSGVQFSRVAAVGV